MESYQSRITRTSNTRVYSSFSSFENQQAPLLVLSMDSLVLLNILQKWGVASINPRSNDILHLDVIFPLLIFLRQWQYPVRVVKVKSHTGSLIQRGPTRGVQSASAAPPSSDTSCTRLRDQSEGATIARAVSRCREAEQRVWVKAMADQCRPATEEST